MKTEAARRAARAWKRRNPEKVKAEKRRWSAKNYAKEEKRELLKAKSRRVYNKIKNTKKYKRHRQEKHLLTAYGLTLAKVEILYKKQRGKCAICKKKFKKLNVDHCHLSGKIRGLLCLKCNVALGLFSECLKSLRSAIKYLRRHK